VHAIPVVAQPADFAVLTIVPEAYEAARRIMRLVDRCDPGDGNLYYAGRLPAHEGGEHLVVCGNPLERSNIPAATFTTLMLLTWRPRRLLVVDIGGGIAGQEGLLLGDVVAHEALYYYEFQKRSGRGYRLRHLSLEPSAARLRTLARDVQLTVQWHEVIDADRPPDAEAGPPIPPRAGAIDRARQLLARPRPPVDAAMARAAPRGIPELTIGDIIVGEKLLGDPADDLLAELLERYDKAKAIEMESAGAAHAAWMLQDVAGRAQFLVVRGISDFANREGNQVTRDLWKPYAAESAVAAAKAIIESERFTAPEPAAARRLAPAAGVLGNYPQSLAVRVAEDSDRPTFLLTVDVDKQTLPALQMPEIVATRRRAVILAPAGAGKSALLRRLARDVGVDPLPVHVDLKRWAPADGDALLELDARAQNREAMDVLLAVEPGDIGIDTVQTVVELQRVFVMVDGLNEVDRPDVADRIIDVLNHYVRSNPGATALVTDRSRAPRYTESWACVWLNPLGEDVVSSQLDSRHGPGTYAARSSEDQPLLALPFFLALAMAGATPELGSRADALRRFFIEQVGVDEGQLAALSDAALDVYRYERSRSFAADAMLKRLGGEVWTKLTAANVISGDGQRRRFEHQLFHDYLSSIALLAAGAGAWTHELLDAVTFHTNSIDPLTLALAQASGADQGDALLRALEDWNWRVTMRAMAAVETEGRLAISQPLRIALLANLAEKRFDPVAASARDADGLLGRFPDDVASAMLAAERPGGLASVVAGLPARDPPRWYEEWRTLFMRDQQLVRDSVREIAHRDGLHGWTAANVLRRFALSADQDRELRVLYESRLDDQDARSASIRWRAIHALGRAESGEVVDLLLAAAANDPYPWARYGAVRALMEIAAREASLRDAVLVGLRPLVVGLDPRQRIQLVRVAEQRGAADGWCAAVRPLLDLVERDDLTDREQANLDRVVSSFEEMCA
jgi:nucleoside phosphorylase